MSEIVYRPFDQKEKLGEPPWRSADPALQAWEKAHGHDVRLKCYPEFGCLAIEDEAERLAAEVRRLFQIVTLPGGQAKVLKSAVVNEEWWAGLDQYPAIAAALTAGG